ncbi:MAG TPA: mannosyltransferase family protein [Vicinamibacterales bacterium]|nr:mannosyltransferase family protein [Vicinamibacterales bacterium]
MPTDTAPARPVPLWARVLDVLCLLLAFVAIIVAISGGFRERLLGVRFAVTSPYPLLIWALVIGAVRHVVAPQSPLHREFPTRVTEWVRLPQVRSAAVVVAGTRPAMLLVGYLAVFMVGYVNGRAPLRHFDNELLNLPVRWDAGWYLQIVTDGYRYVPSDSDLQQNIVFFPAYPMLVRLVGRLFGGHTPGYIAAGMLISLAAFCGALVYLYMFARDALGEEKAGFALWLLASYPFALFFGALYTESLFLVSVIGAFYHLTKGHLLGAAFWGLLAGLTKLNGVMLCLPLALVVVSPWLSPALVRDRFALPLIAQPRESKDGRLTLAGLGVAAMPAVGMLLYSAFIWRLTGDPLAWAKGHIAWGRTYQSLTTFVTTQYAFIANAGLSGYLASPGYDVLNALGALFVLTTAWPVARRLGLSYAVLMVLMTLPPIVYGGWLSAGRFSSVMFPAFVWLANVIPQSQRSAWLVGFGALQAFNAALFYTWRPLF